MTEMLRQMPVRKQNGSCVVKTCMKVQCHCGEDIGIQGRHPAGVCFIPMPILGWMTTPKSFNRNRV